MGHQVKRFLSLLLCGVMLVSLSAVHVHAASGSQACSNPGGHVFQGVKDTNPESVGYYPECPNAEVYQLKCMYCDQERGYYGGQHEWSDWTDNGDGTRSRACELCGEGQTGKVPAPSHTHTLVTVTTSATCTQDGVTYQRCTKCDYEGPRTVLPATGHDPVDDDDCRTPPRCSVCGELLWDGKTYPAVHNFSGPYEYDENGHWQHCQNPGCSAVSATARHRTTGGVADCTKGEVCSECGATVSTARGHNFENAKVGITTAAGHYLICANPGCGQTQFFAHSFSAGKCAVCGVADPNYKPAQEPERQEEPENQGPQEEQNGQKGPEEPAAPENPVMPEEPVTSEEPATPEEKAPQEGQKEPEEAQEPKPVQGTQASQGSQTAQTTQGTQASQTAQATQETQASQETQTAQVTQVTQEPQVSQAVVAQVTQAPAVTEKFSDVSAGAWYAGSVQRVVEAGLMNGVSDSAFSPNTNVNRAMLATILYRLAGEPGPGVDNFGDVKATAYYADAVSWAAATGMVTGYGNNSFHPNQDITRQELATILYRYAKWMGYAVDGGKDLSAYTDRGQIASWARDAMAWANGAGLINGRGENTLAPTATATRAEVATMMARMMDLMAQ